MASDPNVPVDVLPISPGYVEDSDDDFPRPIIAIGRSAHREYQACALDDGGSLVFVKKVRPDGSDF